MTMRIDQTGYVFKNTTQIGTLDKDGFKPLNNIKFSKASIIELATLFGGFTKTATEMVNTPSFDVNAIRGQYVAVTGKINGLIREEVNKMVTALGGYNLDKVVSYTKFLVVGKGSGDSHTRKLQAAQSYKIQIVPAQAFVNAYNEWAIKNVATKAAF